MVEIETVDDSDDDNINANHNANNLSSPPSPPKIQLGFSEPIRPEDASVIGHRSVRWWKDWDGGQLGGRPSWLQPRDLPAKKALTCLSCESTKPLQFLCQLYVPLDHTPRAFHRSFYIFGCPTCCQSQSSSSSSSKNHNDIENGGPISKAGQGIRVLRVQLPQDNDFYPREHATEKVVDGWDKHLPSTWNVHLCHVCGQRAAGKCPLQQVWFCGKEHQKEYKRSLSSATSTSLEGKAQVAPGEPSVTAPTNGSQEEENREEEAALLEELSTADTSTEAVTSTSSSTTTVKYLPSVYAESELVVEEEPAAGSKTNEDDDDDDDDEIEARPAMFPTISSSSPGDDGNDSDEDLEQEDLNEMVTGTKSLDQTSTKDPATNRFHHRIQDRTVPEQCLRYTMEWRRMYDTGDDSGGDDNACEDNPTKAIDADADDERHSDDSQPLWIRSDHQPSTIPPCPYCQAPRAFEFQLMPQMLSFLHANRPSPSQNSGSGDGSSPATPSPNETAKQALMAAQSIIANTDPSQVPPSFAEAKAKAMKALQEDLYQGDAHRVDWGVVAIYSCTKSCAGSEPATGAEGTTGEKHHLGVYREEFAWLQPSLDV